MRQVPSAAAKEGIMDVLYARIPRVMTIYQFLLGMVLALYMGFSRLNHLRFVAQDPMLIGIVQVGNLPPRVLAPRSGWCGQTL